MQEMLAPTTAIKGVGLGESCAMVTDGRFSGGTAGASIGPSRGFWPRPTVYASFLSLARLQQHDVPGLLVAPGQASADAFRGGSNRISNRHPTASAYLRSVATDGECR